VGLYIPGLAHRGVAVMGLRGVLTDAGTCRLTASLRGVFATDPDLLIIDLGGLRGWDDSGQRQLAGAAGYLASRGSQMTLSAAGAHLKRTEPQLAALEMFADVPAVLAGGPAAGRLRRLPRMRRRCTPGFSRAELLRHAHYPMPSRAGQIAAAQHWAGTVLAAWKLPGAADAAVAGLTELAANALTYGFASTVDVTLRLWRNADSTWSLTVGVHDGNSAPPVWRAPAAADPRRGWGLLVMASSADTHGWYPDPHPGAPGKTVWFARHIHPRRPADGHRTPPACS
jgi:anti-anti-sigma regulatory factor